MLRFPFGVAGHHADAGDDWRGTARSISRAHGLVPDAEAVVEHMYGEDWRLPKPGFNWRLDRTDAATDGGAHDPAADQDLLGRLLRAHRTRRSTFFEFVRRVPGLPDT